MIVREGSRLCFLITTSKIVWFGLPQIIGSLPAANATHCTMAPVPKSKMSQNVRDQRVKIQVRCY